MNINKLAQNAIAINELKESSTHETPSTIYVSLMYLGKDSTPMIVRMVVENKQKALQGMDVLYAIKKDASTTPASLHSKTATRGDTTPARLKESDTSKKVPSIVSIEDFLRIVNSSDVGGAALSNDVHEYFGSNRKEEPRITPHLKFSAKDYDPTNPSAACYPAITWK